MFSSLYPRCPTASTYVSPTRLPLSVSWKGKRLQEKNVALLRHVMLRVLGDENTPPHPLLCITEPRRAAHPEQRRGVHQRHGNNIGVENAAETQASTLQYPYSHTTTHTHTSELNLSIPLLFQAHWVGLGTRCASTVSLAFLVYSRKPSAQQHPQEASQTARRTPRPLSPPSSEI